ncbi:MAG: hypothetical protein ABJL57_03060 [Hyphomonas sp.]
MARLEEETGCVEIARAVDGEPVIGAVMREQARIAGEGKAAGFVGARIHTEDFR